MLRGEESRSRKFGQANAAGFLPERQALDFFLKSTQSLIDDAHVVSDMHPVPGVRRISPCSNS